MVTLDNEADLAAGKLQATLLHYDSCIKERKRLAKEFAIVAKQERAVATAKAKAAKAYPDCETPSTVSDAV
jgi:hypothetical protein